MNPTLYCYNRAVLLDWVTLCQEAEILDKLDRVRHPDVGVAVAMLTVAIEVLALTVTVFPVADPQLRKYLPRSLQLSLIRIYQIEPCYAYTKVSFLISTRFVCAEFSRTV